MVEDDEVKFNNVIKLLGGLIDKILTLQEHITREM